MANGSPSAAGRTGWAAMVAVFALVIGFTYSDDAVEFLTDVTGGRESAWRWLVVLIDVVLVAGTAVLAWHTTGRRPLGVFLRELITGWWSLGAALVIGVHLLLLGTAGGGHRWSVGNSPWLTLLTTTAFVAAMGMLLVSTLGGGGSRAWIAPVIIGTFVAQLASALWYPVIDTNGGCAGEISTDYFNGMVQVLPVFLITLGLELNYLRSRGIRDPGQRAVAVLTVLLLCVAQALTFSILVKTGQTHCGVGPVWHEYIAFMTTVHAAAISLATLAWLLLSSTAEPA